MTYCEAEEELEEALRKLTQGMAFAMHDGWVAGEEDLVSLFNDTLPSRNRSRLAVVLGTLELL